MSHIHILTKQSNIMSQIFVGWTFVLPHRIKIYLMHGIVCFFLFIVSIRYSTCIIYYYYFRLIVYSLFFLSGFDKYFVT